MESLSFIKPIAFEISRNVIFGGMSILGLGLFTYLAKRYLNTDNKTTNQYYTKPNETIHIPNLTLTNNKQNIIYVFWNGDINSSYLLVDLLLQDKIIQPLYIEKYTILKALEYNNLETLTKQYIANTNTNANANTTANANANAKISGLKDTTANAKIKQYLEDIARIKKNQINEITKLEIFRKIILNQYPEFQNNLLPTIYITTIAKDLEHTLNFFSILKEISPLYYNGIELLEQITRFIKYYKPINKSNSRILIAYTKDSINIDLVNKILISNKLNLDNKIEMPLQDIDNKNIMFLASNLPNDIIKYFK